MQQTRFAIHLRRSSGRFISSLGPFTLLAALVMIVFVTTAQAQEQDASNEPALVRSEVCLGCHGSATDGAHAGHAVGVYYDEAARRRALRPSDSRSGFGSTVANDLLVDGRVECTSCHYTHDHSTVTPFRLRLLAPHADPIAPTVRVVSTSLCVNCHDLTRM